MPPSMVNHWDVCFGGCLKDGVPETLGHFHAELQREGIWFKCSYSHRITQNSCNKVMTLPFIIILAITSDRRDLVMRNSS